MFSDHKNTWVENILVNKMNTLQLEDLDFNFHNYLKTSLSFAFQCME